MWFKNIYAFAFTRPFELSEKEIEERLSENAFTPCASTEMSHFGFVNALGKHGTTYVHSVNDVHLICARREEKILPAQVVAEEVGLMVEALEREHGRPASKKEKSQFKEDVVMKLLPRAFSRISDTRLFICPKSNIIVVDASSRGKSEDVLALCRKAFGTLPIASVTPERAPDEIMTGWLSGEDSLSADFQIGMEAELSALGDDAGVVRLKSLDLASEEVKKHLDTNMYVNKLALEFDESMSFVLADDLSVKRLKYFDVLVEQNDDIDSDDVAAKLDADFVLMSGELARMLVAMFGQFSCDPLEYLEGK